MEEYEAFSESLKNLREIYDYEEPYENLVLAGITVLYRECIKQILRLMKELMRREGYPKKDTEYPRQVLKASYRHGLIADMRLWMKALEDGKYLEWAGNEVNVLEFVRNIKEHYFPLFCELQKEILNNWMGRTLPPQSDNG